MLKIYLKLLQKYRPSAGWTLAELMMATAMTFVVVMVAGFGLVTVLRENKVANATGEMQYDLNRATDFISEEIRNAKTIETKMSELKFTAKDVLAELNIEVQADGQLKHKDPNKKKQPILALKIDGVHERVVYYVEEVDNGDIWRGPAVIRRFGPDFNEDGNHNDDTKTNIDKWRHTTLVDMMVSDLDPDQKQCKNLPDTTANANTYTAIDDQGNEWYRWPQADADVKGFFSCIRKDKQLAQLNVLGTSLDEFKHLYDEDKAQRMVRDKDKQTRHTAKMEYNVTTMVHSRSEVMGSSGEKVPRYLVTPGISFQEDGKATMTLLYANVPCSDNIDNYSEMPSTDQITASVVDVTDAVAGSVTGPETSGPHNFSEGQFISVHVSEEVFCTSPNGKVELNDHTQNNPHVRFATNDNSDHPKLNDIIPNPSSDIVNKLTQANFIKLAEDGTTYDFTLPDNIVLYFVEFGFYKDVIDPITRQKSTEEQGDPPHFDDVIYFVEITK